MPITRLSCIHIISIGNNMPFIQKVGRVACAYWNSIPSFFCMDGMPESPRCCSAGEVAMCTEIAVPSTAIFRIGVSVWPGAVFFWAGGIAHPLASNATMQMRRLIFLIA